MVERSVRDVVEMVKRSSKNDNQTRRKIRKIRNRKIRKIRSWLDEPDTERDCVASKEGGKYGIGLWKWSWEVLMFCLAKSNKRRSFDKIQPFGHSKTKHHPDLPRAHWDVHSPIRTQIPLRSKKTTKGRGGYCQKGGCEGRMTGGSQGLEGQLEEHKGKGVNKHYGCNETRMLRTNIKHTCILSKIKHKACTMGWAWSRPVLKTPPGGSQVTFEKVSQ